MIDRTLTLWLNMARLFLLLAVLAGCGTVSTAPTATSPPTSTVTPVPTSTATLVPTSTATPTPTPAVETNQLITTNNFEGVIFTAASTEQMRLDIVIGEKTEGYWTPGRDDVLVFEQRLEPYLQQAAPQTYPGPLRELNVYQRQYVGILVDEQRVIFANFFCNAYDTDWQREIVFVLDGGSCYFEVKYDVETDEFYDLSIHGEA